jgi:phage terminase large subunit GpA-like protein
LMVQPTDNANNYGKKHITPLIEACPVLHSKIKAPTSRRTRNTLALKEFPGGFLKLTGANSGAGHRSDPIPNRGALPPSLGRWFDSHRPLQISR